MGISHNVFAQNTKEITSVPLKLTSPIDSASYAMGLNIGSDFKKSGLDTLLKVDLVFKGLQDAFQESGIFTEEEYNEILNAFFYSISEKRAKMLTKLGEEILAENRSKPNIIITPSGLQYEVIYEGKGEKPKAKNVVIVHYTGYHADGEVFESSFDNGFPGEYSLKSVIPGWLEGLQLMSKGSKYIFYIPAELAYGSYGMLDGGIAPDEMLIFEIELIDFK